MKLSGHAFQPGAPGSYQELYCQAAPEAGTEPVPGYPGRTCGHLESAHSMTPQQEAEADKALVDRLVKQIGGWAS